MSRIIKTLKKGLRFYKKKIRIKTPIEVLGTCGDRKWTWVKDWRALEGEYFSGRK